MPARRSRVPGLPILVAVLAAFLVAVPPAAARGATPAATAPHYALEKFALRLINCTRTGGWVKKDGTCIDYGTGKHSRYRPPLKLRAALSNLISRPYARKIAKANYCGHDYGGRSITGAFHHAGFYGVHWGESIGCGTWSPPRRDVIETHRLMQAEKPYNGWHWRNMKNPDFNQVGIGVAVVDGVTRIVEDFYHP